MMPRLQAALAALPLLLLLGGCFALAHASVEMPPLQVEGVLLGADGKPVVDDLFSIALADFYGTEKTFAALDAGTLDPDSYDYRSCETRTGASGEFSCKLDGESRYIGFLYPFMKPSQEKMRGFEVGLRMVDGLVFGIAVSGADGIVVVRRGPEFKLEKSPRLPIGVKAKVSRSDDLDVLRLELRKQ